MITLKFHLERVAKHRAIYVEVQCYCFCGSARFSCGQTAIKRFYLSTFFHDIDLLTVSFSGICRLKRTFLVILFFPFCFSVTLNSQRAITFLLFLIMTIDFNLPLGFYFFSALVYIYIFFIHWPYKAKLFQIKSLFIIEEYYVLNWNVCLQ